MGCGRIEPVLVGLEKLVKFLEVGFPLADETLQLAQLGQPNGSLHVGHLQVVADMAVNIFVIVTGG